MHIGQALAWSRIYNHAANKKIYQMGVNPPADIASGRIAEAFLNKNSIEEKTRKSKIQKKFQVFSFCYGIFEGFLFCLLTYKIGLYTIIHEVHYIKRKVTF